MVQARDAERMKKAEKEVAENLPEGMVGLDSEDVRDVEAEPRADEDAGSPKA